MQELRRMHMFELNVSLGLKARDEWPLTSMPKKCLIRTIESNAIVLYNSFQNLSLPSQANIGNFDNITS